jgi:hypothetical protein
LTFDEHLTVHLTAIWRRFDEHLTTKWRRLRGYYRAKRVSPMYNHIMKYYDSTLYLNNNLIYSINEIICIKTYSVSYPWHDPSFICQVYHL